MEKLIVLVNMNKYKPFSIFMSLTYRTENKTIENTAKIIKKLIPTGKPFSFKQHAMNFINL